MNQSLNDPSHDLRLMLNYFGAQVILEAQTEKSSSSEMEVESSSMEASDSGHNSCQQNFPTKAKKTLDDALTLVEDKEKAKQSLFSNNH